MPTRLRVTRAAVSMLKAGQEVPAPARVRGVFEDRLMGSMVVRSIERL
jgi:hypothetical protein